MIRPALGLAAVPALLFAALPLILFASPTSPSQEQAAVAAPAPAWTQQKLVAHALGGINGLTYTNAYEAFALNYNRGFRLFEVDLQLTSDQVLVARHEWGAGFNRKLEQTVPDTQNAAKPMTYAQFKSLPINQSFKPLDFSDLLSMLKSHADMYLITDTKDTEPKQVALEFGQITSLAEKSDPGLLAHVIPQLYSTKMYDDVERIYPFAAYILTLYESKDSNQEVLDFVKTHPKIKAITMPESRVTTAFVNSLKQAGLSIYVHTINDTDTYERYADMGFNGVYTDELTPAMLVDATK